MRLNSIEPTPFHSLSYWTSGPGGTPNQRELPFFHAKAEGLPDGIGSLVLLSDLQGREYLSENLAGTERLLGEAVAEELSLLVGLGEIPQISTVMVCGDLYDYPDCRKPGGTGPVEMVFLALSDVSRELIAVLGNHDTLVSQPRLPAKITILDGNVITSSFGLRIGGLGGIVGDPKRYNRRDEDTFIRDMELCTRKCPHILMLHQGPEDKERCRKGNPAITQSLEKSFSGLTLFGHTHWPDCPLIEIGDGQALNLDAKVVVIVPGNNDLC